MSDRGFRGRSRSRSFVADEEEEQEDYRGGRKERSRSRSFVSDGDSSFESESQTDVIAKAASRTKIYMKGSKPVDPNSLPKPKRETTKTTRVRTGKLTEKALGTLSDGLQDAVRLKEKNAPTEAELEERKLAAAEATQLKDDKKLTISKPSRARALATKATANFKSRFFGGGSSSSSSSNSGSTSTSTSSSTSNVTSTSTNDKIQAKNSHVADDTSSSSSPPPAPVRNKRHKLKLLLLGDSGVGKSSLIRVMSGDPFAESMLATAGVDFKMRNISIEGEEVALQVWDTAGQERFHRITATYYKGANGIVLVYDVNDRHGFDNVGYWMNNIQQYSQRMPAMLLVGNKIDLPNRMVTPEEGMAAAAQYHCRFLETSAKTSENVEDAVHTIAADSLYLSINDQMTQHELLEKERKYGAKGLKNENCNIS